MKVAPDSKRHRNVGCSGNTQMVNGYTCQNAPEREFIKPAKIRGNLMPLNLASKNFLAYP